MAALIIALTVTGCSSPSNDETSVTEYTEPAWMAEVRAQDEEFTSAKAACLEGQGVVVAVVGADVLMINDVDAQGEVAPGIEEATERAGSFCDEQVPPQPYRESPPVDAYTQLLDIQRCVEAQGYSLPEPPSREKWEEEEGERYSPYSFLLDPGPGRESISGAEFNELVEVCPQGTASSVFFYEAGS